MATERTDDIATRRLLLGLSQKRLGEMIGIDQSKVSRAEQGSLPEIAARLREALDSIERQRDSVERAEAEEFWKAAKDAPKRDRVIARLEEVARDLLVGTLREAELGNRLLDCLPKTRRKRVLSDLG